MIADLLTNFLGILVFPFLGNSLRTVSVSLSLLEEEELELLTVERELLWLLDSLLWLRLFVLIISLSLTRSG